MKNKTVSLLNVRSFRRASSACCELLFEEVEFHLRVDVLPPQTGDFNSEFCDLLGLSNGRFLEVECDLLEGLDVGYSLQLLHAVFSQ